MDLDFKEEDIEVLDRMLKYIVDDSGIHSQYDFESHKIIPKLSATDYVCYASIIGSHCGHIQREGFGTYNIKSDNRTACFYKKGGFRVFYLNFKQREEENNELKALQKKYFKLQNENAQYEKKMRIWRFLSILFGIMSAVLTFMQILSLCKN